jgi:ABC-type transport system substrate-binding protein
MAKVRRRNMSDKKYRWLPRRLLSDGPAKEGGANGLMMIWKTSTAEAMKTIGCVTAALFLSVLLVASAAPAQQPGGTIIMALGADPETLNPGITTGYAVGAITANIFSGLIRLGPRGEVLPQLATAWQVAPDARTYTFTLRRGVRWHDGRPFSAADVKFSLEEIAGKFHGRFRIAYTWNR